MEFQLFRFLFQRQAGCTVRITVCDYRNNPPTKLIIGADPVPAIPATPASTAYTGEVCGRECTSATDSGCNPCSGGGCCIVAIGKCTSWSDLKCPTNYFCHRYSNGVTGCVCSSNLLSDLSGWGACCPNGYVGVLGKNLCCPKDHPIYDPSSGNCVKNATVETNKVGNCAVLTTTLETAFTDITFANDAGEPLSTADYVAVAYYCPE